jgi:hypothetical protein
MFAERFIVYTQTVEDVNGTVMGRVFKFAMDIPGLNFISIAMHSMTTDRFSACSAILLSFIYLVHQQERQGHDQRRCQVVSSHNWPVILCQHNQSTCRNLRILKHVSHVCLVARYRGCGDCRCSIIAALPFLPYQLAS